jgi:quercetin dioxygenase-like cupin family protein
MYMSSELPPQPLVQSLPQGQVWSLHTQHAQTLQVLAGRIWLTMDACSEDFFMRQSDQLSLPAGRHVVVEAWSEAPAEPAVFSLALIT